MLPYANFSLRLRKEDIAELPRILAAFPRERWLELRRNLGCVWPRIMWLRAQKPALVGGAGGGAAEAARRQEYDAWETLMASLARKAALQRGEPQPPWQWWAATPSCHRRHRRSTVRHGAAPHHGSP